MELEEDPVDAWTLARRAMKQDAPGDLLRAQAEMVLWGLRSIPIGVLDLAPRDPVDAVTRAVSRALDEGMLDATVPRVFERWIDGLNLDWATRQALEALCRSVERLFSPAEWSLGEGETDLPETVQELVRAAGLWAWDELLSESSEYGDPGGKHEAQVIERARVEDDANRALCSILRRCVPGLDAVQPEP